MLIKLTMIQTIGLAMVLLFIGRWLRRNVYFFERFAIPSAVIGGFLFALINLVFHANGVLDIEFDTTLQTFFMILFFTSIGFGASPKILKASGPKVLLFLVCATLLCILQNGVAFLLAPVAHVSRGLALMTGSTPMTGGHGTSAGIAPLLEAAGVSGAQTVAYTAATFGLVAGSLMGGPLANYLIMKKDLLHKRDKYEQRHLDSALMEDAPRDQYEQIMLSPDTAPEVRHRLQGDRMLRGFMLMLVAMLLGSFVTDLLNQGMSHLTKVAQFPAYLGPMLFGVLARAISDFMPVKDKNGVQHTIVPSQEVEILGDVSLNVFLSMALMSVKLWQLADLAGPIVILLIGQLVLMFFFARYVTFPMMGSTYDAAVLTAGHCGFGMGATPNGVANMESLVSKFVDSKTAFFVLPIVGSMFIDFVNIIIITGFMYFI
ncbi:MAG: sodium:glutamate symporter [Arcanobacterium sp.]|nr:sodium:glutamate symporter [Arcanobacterium sp.]MDY5588547.1 sodium/glutamate symporter [Arcanobacterium sp.]